MRIINRVERKGSLVEFDKGDILEELRQVKKNQFHLYFSYLIDLDVLELKILKHILNGNNKEIAFQTLDKRYKKVWLLTWNKYCNRLIYRDSELRYTLIFSRGGVLIYPNSLDVNKCLKVSLHFLGTLEMAGCLR